MCHDDDSVTKELASLAHSWHRRLANAVPVSDRRSVVSDQNSPVLKGRADRVLEIIRLPVTAHRVDTSL